jgi:thiol-disulfide isomerase/thioredoxin
MFKKQPKAPKVESLREIETLASSGKPVLIDFYQPSCAPCQVMGGIMNELSREFGESAHVIKADISRMPDVAHKFEVRSTPTMVLLTTSAPKKSKKTRNGRSTAVGGVRPVTQRWRASGLVQKDILTKMLESNGAQKVS